MRTFLLLVFGLLTVALGVGGYLAYQHYRGLESELRVCTSTESAHRSELGIRSAELQTLRRDNALQQAELVSVEQWKAQNEILAKQSAAFHALATKLQRMIDTGKLRIMVRKGRMILKLPAEILFSSGQADLSKNGRAALTEMALVLKDFPDRSFMVAGHTDNEPVKDSGYRSNWQLSLARALTVTEFFVENGVKPENVVAAGYGEFDPIASNDNARGRRENRRLELVLLPNVEELPKLIQETKDLTASAMNSGSAVR